MLDFALLLVTVLFGSVLVTVFLGTAFGTFAKLGTPKGK